MPLYQSNAITGWFVLCSTGCSCCRDDNYAVGPFTDKDEAVVALKRPTGLASHYSRNGHASLIETTGTHMSSSTDEFFIFQDRVFRECGEYHYESSTYDHLDWHGIDITKTIPK